MRVSKYLIRSVEVTRVREREGVSIFGGREMIYGFSRGDNGQIFAIWNLDSEM